MRDICAPSAAGQICGARTRAGSVHIFQKPSTITLLPKHCAGQVANRLVTCGRLLIGLLRWAANPGCSWLLAGFFLTLRPSGSAATDASGIVSRSCEREMFHPANSIVEPAPRSFKHPHPADAVAWRGPQSIYFTVNGTEAETFSHSICSLPLLPPALERSILSVSTGAAGFAMVRAVRPSSSAG